MKKIILLFLVVFSCLGGISTWAEVSLPSQIFDLGNGITANWNKDTQVVEVQGQGKMDWYKWRDFKNALSLTTNSIEKIEFGELVQFPDDAIAFFQGVKASRLVFHPNMSTSNVTNMTSMFREFEGDIPGTIAHWDVSNVTNMYSMFWRAYNFNQDISRWNVGKVTNMAWLFGDAHAFNQDVSSWDVSKVVTMEAMFENTKSLTKPLTFRDASSAQKMSSMFKFSSIPSVSIQKTSNVTDMAGMFWESKVEEVNFDDTSNVINMYSMFWRARNFNAGNISDWNVSKVTNMQWFLDEADKFDLDISKWNLDSLKAAHAFMATTSFSPKNYENFLAKLDTLSPELLKQINGMNVGVSYCNAAFIKQSLLAKGFQIIDKGFDCESTIALVPRGSKISKEAIGISVIFQTNYAFKATDPLPDNLVRIKDGEGNVLPSDMADFACSLTHPWEETDPFSKISCKGKIITTHGASRQLFVYVDYPVSSNDRLVSEKQESGFLIDTQAPAKVSDYILAVDSSTNPTKATFTLKSFPIDNGGAGVKSCSIDNQILQLDQATDLPLSGNPPYIVEIVCQDNLGNASTTEIKFPPIVVFDRNNVTLKKEFKPEDTLTFFVYSPDGNPIQNIRVDGVSSLECLDKDQNSNFPLVNGTDEDLRIKCTVSGINQDLTDLKVLAEDDKGAEGQAYLSLTRDINAPNLSFKTDPVADPSGKVLTGGKIDFVFEVSDDYRLDPQSPIILSGVFAKYQADLKCAPEIDGSTKLTCTLSIDSPLDADFEIQLKDFAGNSKELKLGHYIIDKEDPSIAVQKADYTDSHTKYHIQFSVSDNGGAGLDEKEPLSYAFVDAQQDCTAPLSRALPFPLSASLNALEFDITDLSYNGKYLCLLAKDQVGRTTLRSFGPIALQKIQVPNVQVGGGGSGGGGSGVLVLKSEKNEPKSDGVTSKGASKVEFIDSDIFNSTVENGLCYTRRPYQGIQDSLTISTSEEFKKALSFLWSYEMTMYDSVDGYDPYRNLSREEAAKIFSQFAMNVLCRKPDKNLKINYSDVENANPTLKPYITLAYQLGVMKGSGMGDGLFRPFDYISKAEVNAVLIRMILKSYLDETGTTWYHEYNKVSESLKITQKWPGSESLSRNDLALMLFRAYKHQEFEWRELGYFSFVLKLRDLFVK